MLQKSTWSHLQENGDCIESVTDLVCKDSKVSDSCFQSGEIDSVGNEFCTDDPNLCHFQLPDISSADNDLEFFGNEQHDAECRGLFDYGWPDIGNFEDVDQMFRNCDSTYGQQNNSTADESSWFSPPSHTINGTEEPFKLGFRSKFDTDPNFSPDGRCPVFDDNDQNNMSSAVNSWTSDIDEASNIGFYSYTSWLDGDCQNKTETATGEQGNDTGGGEQSNLLISTRGTSGSSITGSHVVNKVNMPKQPKCEVQLEGKRKERSSEFLNDSVIHDPIQVKKYTNSMNSAPLQGFSQPKKYWESSTMNYLRGPTSYLNVGGHHYPVPRSASTSKSENKKHQCYELANQTPDNVHPLRKSSDHRFKSSVVLPEEKSQKFQKGQQLCSQFSSGSKEQTASHVGIDVETPTQKQNRVQDELGGDSEAEVTRVECLDSSAVQDSSSCMSSIISNGISPEAASFRQLQDVMEQLDIRTKLCIRDSLYRLARSAEQRHMNSSSKDQIEKRAGSMSDETNKCMAFTDAETNTNPIDRSIAHLLFSRPSEPSLGASSDDLSLESNIMVNGCRTNQPEMPDGIEDVKDA